MKKSKQILTVLLLVMLVLSVLCVPAFALTESEVETQVASAGKEAVTGNVLIWFLCAVAFLKVSQKIDSFMATLGVNVGRTSGSMLAEAMIAMRAVTMVVGGGHGGWRWPGRFCCWKCSGQVRLLRDDRVLQGRPDWNGWPAYHQQRAQDGHNPDIRCPYRSEPGATGSGLYCRSRADSG